MRFSRAKVLYLCTRRTEHRKDRWFLLFLCMACVYGLVCLSDQFYNVIIVQNFLCADIKPDQRHVQDNKKVKTVFGWTTMWNDPFFPAGQQAFAECPESRCEVIEDRCMASQADVLLFHWIRVVTWRMPTYHPPHQIWALVTIESQSTFPNPRSGAISELNGQFNWTITHRWDSEIYQPYFYFMEILKNPPRLRPLLPPGVEGLGLTRAQRQLVERYEVNASKHVFTRPDPPGINYAANKKGLVLWYITNCRQPSSHHRNEMFRELSKHMTITVYGSRKCGLGTKPDPCGRNQQCMRELMASYKFYLGFENSKCKDYITEKAWNPLHNGAIPIVLGPSQLQYETVLPPNSFLHVDNFTSVHALARFMHHLDYDDDAYNSYHQWRQHYVTTKVHEKGFACKLCEKLWQKKQPSHTYHSFTSWWDEASHCIV